MPIRVQCPNDTCRQIFSVRDEYAGKRGKCPGCGSALMIPSASGREAVSPRQPPAARERPTGGDLAAATDTSEAPSVRLADELRLPPAEVDAVPPPGPAGPRPGNLLAGYAMAELATRTALVVGIIALVLLSFIPQVRWLYVSESSRDVNVRGRIEFMQLDLALRLTTEGAGTTLLFYSALLTVLAILCLVGLDLLPREPADALLAAQGALAVGWGLTVFFWMAGFVWKSFTTASKFGRKDLTILPGFGLVLGFFAALAVMAVFGYLVVSRRRFIWLGTAAFLGFLFGVLLLIFNARPWEAWQLGLG